jgi:hypothetical protein
MRRAGRSEGVKVRHESDLGLRRGAESALHLSRRRLGGLVVGAAGWWLAPGLVRPGFGAVPAVPASVAFDVYRDGGKIGFHRIDFAPAGAGFAVDVAIELDVKLAFVTLYHYRQEGHDLWQDGILTRTRVHTDDNGEVSTLQAEAQDGRLAVAGAAGACTVPLGTMTDLCFWNEAIVRSQEVVDAQTGEVAPLRSEAGPRETIEADGRSIVASRYAVVGTKGRTGTIWYDANGRWVKATITTRGETLEYRLVQPLLAAT